MGDPFEGMVGLLAEEVDLHRRLLALARDEQRALVRSHPAELDLLISRQEAVVAEIRRVERAQREIRALLADREGRAPDELTASALVRSATPDTAARFEQLRATLAGVIGEVADVNMANARLIRDHIAHLSAVVDTLAGAATAMSAGSASTWEYGSSLVEEARGDAIAASRTVR